MTNEDILKLINARDFADAWFKALPNYPTYEAAYESIEAEYQKVFKVRRYSDYNSFRNVKNKLFYKRK